MKDLKRMLRFSALLLALVFSLAGCPTEAKDDNSNNNNNNTDDGISWANEPNGTLTVTNNTGKDMVIFQGQTPSPSTIIGGIRGTTARTFDISDDVDDFNVGGYLILRGISLDEYTANKNNLSRAKIEYSAMATYGQGKKYRAEISPNYVGDYGYKVTNVGRIGMELRKNSPDGEKIAYLPSLATNVMLYADSAESIRLFPVLVYYNKQSGSITTIKPDSLLQSVGVGPRPLNDPQIPTRTFPADSTTQWEQIKNSIVSPVAYITVTNNIPNQDVKLAMAGSNAMKAQNGYDSINSGEQLTFELESTAAGTAKNLVAVLYEGLLNKPITFEGEDSEPTIKNGYDYTVTLRGSGSTLEGYTAVITESASARDLSSMIESL
jgi:hypothetical protein